MFRRIMGFSLLFGLVITGVGSFSSHPSWVMAQSSSSFDALRRRVDALEKHKKRAQERLRKHRRRIKELESDLGKQTKELNKTKELLEKHSRKFEQFLEDNEKSMRRVEKHKLERCQRDSDCRDGFCHWGSCAPKETVWKWTCRVYLATQAVSCPRGTVPTGGGSSPLGASRPSARGWICQSGHRCFVRCCEQRKR